MTKEDKTSKKIIRRQFEGEVVSVVGHKTIKVLVKTAVMHPKYRKQYTKVKKYTVHDEKGQAKVGDKVVFKEGRPISKTKRWYLTKVL